MTSVGETLRRERVRRGLELEQISRELKISARFLGAIEDDDFEKLPGGVFAKSFVRQYARMLGLEEEELAGEVQRVVEPQPATLPSVAKPNGAPSEIRVPRVEEWESAGERRLSSTLPALALVVVVMLLCSGVYAWWQRKAHPVSAHEDLAAAIQPAPVAAVPQPEAQPPQTTQPATPDPAAVPRAVVPAPESAATPPVQQPSGHAERAPTDTSVPTPTAAPQAAESPPVQTPPANNTASAVPAAQSSQLGPVHLELTAIEPVWVLAQANGKFLFSGTLDPSQTRTLDATGKVVVRLGNAGNITFSLNGKPIGTVGPKGQVRTVQFTSGGFQIVAAPKPALLDPLDPL